MRNKGIHTKTVDKDITKGTPRAAGLAVSTGARCTSQEDDITHIPVPYGSGELISNVRRIAFLGFCLIKVSVRLPRAADSLTQPDRLLVRIEVE